MKKTLLTIVATLSFGYANAQIKVGSNPTTVNSALNLEVEATNATKLAVDKATGKVGIGTTTPTDMLTVRNSTAQPVVMVSNGGNTAFSALIGVKNEGVRNAYLGVDPASSTLFLLNYGSGSLDMGNNGILKSSLVMTDGGKIGIGTTTPSNAFHVVAAADPIKAEGLQSGSASDLFVSTDANGIFHTLSAAKPQIAAVRTTSGATTARGGAGSAYHFPTALALVNTIPLVTIAANGDITLPAGTYQVVVTLDGSVASDATPPATGFYMHSYFYDFKTTGSSVRIHNNTSSNVGGASNHGLSISYITTVNAGTIFPFNIGWGQGGNAGISANLLFGTGCQLAITKLL